MSSPSTNNHPAPADSAPAAPPTPTPIILPRYTPLILAPRRRRGLNPSPLEPAHPYTTEYWVHWTYTEDEWMAWAEQELASARREYDSYQAMIRVVAMGLLLVAVAASVLLAVGSLTPAVFLPVLVLIAGAILFIGLDGRSGQYAVAEALYRLRREGPREIAIGPWWIWEAGQAIPLLYYSYSRLVVGLTIRPPLQILFRVGERPAWYAKQDTIREISLLVPQGHEAEADALIGRFRREIIHNPISVHPPRQEPTPPPPLTLAPAITQHLPPLPALPDEADTQRLNP